MSKNIPVYVVSDGSTVFGIFSTRAKVRKWINLEQKSYKDTNLYNYMQIYRLKLDVADVCLDTETLKYKTVKF